MKKLVFFAVVLFLVPAVFAEGYTVESSGERYITKSIQNGDTINMKGFTGRSYCCKVRGAETYTSSPYFSSVKMLGTDVPYSKRGKMEPSFPTNEEHLHDSEMRLCFFAVDGVLHGDPHTLTVAVQSAGEWPMDFKCSETTLYGSFNTSVNQINYLELVNTSSVESISAKITIVDSITGTTYGPFVRTIGANEREDIAIHDILPNPGFGRVIVDNDAPRSALRATVSQYLITSADPFLFTLQSRESFTVRNNRE